ncbi:DUF3618 domain-containing protein [Corynebacterium comes]|uniref:DUF3618 domain-containing protein n=1 Tax=Corynebacterium comes TaxID=2675218 RepID=A0A6B8W090_9CORY|nr:DUF3618 domain-containing protein [Corynebacterium comes]QGU05407.1 hypothetical protein CETAM_10815 [Corynebacterium comes]
MSNNPDDIRADIERTRGNLGRDVDALAEKVDPNRVVERQTDRLKSRWVNMRESVFGSDDADVRDGGPGRVSQLADDAGEAVGNAPDTIRRKTRGNPLAAGAIALAAGWIVGSLLPASRPEQEAAAAVRDKAQPLVEEAKSVAQDMGESLQPQAEQAVADVQESARESAVRVREEGQHRIDQVREESTGAAQRVRDTAREG